MTKTKTAYACLACGYHHPKWVGRCPDCGEWGTFVEATAPSTHGAPAAPAPVPRPITQIDNVEFVPLPAGLPEVDRVLGGGFVAGSVTLVGGEPGIGKSTLLLQIAGAYAAQGQRVLYITAEESVHQITARAERLRALHDNLWVVAEGDLSSITRHVATVAPAFVVVDSIQTVSDANLTSAAGTVSQVRDSAHRLAALAKAVNFTLVLVGHVTKDGALAGPRVLEHLVDTVVSFEGDRHHALRLLRVLKHRFGATTELGVFEMRPEGLVEVSDPSRMFLADRAVDLPGSTLVPTIDGQRPFLVELQALVTGGSGRRSAQGLDAGRLGFLLAVLSERAGVQLADRDVYALAVGGVQALEPGADLALCLAIASATRSIGLPPNLAAYGEIGLGGELRRVAHHDERVNECLRLGIEALVLPRHAPPVPRSIRTIRAATVAEALQRVNLGALC